MKAFYINFGVIAVSNPVFWFYLAHCIQWIFKCISAWALIKLFSSVLPLKFSVGCEYFQQHINLHFDQLNMQALFIKTSILAFGKEGALKGKSQQWKWNAKRGAIFFLLIWVGTLGGWYINHTRSSCSSAQWLQEKERLPWLIWKLLPMAGAQTIIHCTIVPTGSKRKCYAKTQLHHDSFHKGTMLRI